MGILYRFLPALVFLLAASTSNARTWFIAADGSGDAPTIQAGVDAASPGDTVLVGAGSYSDTHVIVIQGANHTVSVNLTKNLVLTSRDGFAMTRITGGEICIYGSGLDASSVIRGFDLGHPDDGPMSCGQFVSLAALPRAPAYVVQSGIMVEGSATTITGNYLHGGPRGTSWGVHAIGSSPTISDNDFYRAGIEMLYTTGGVITGNRMLESIIDCAFGSPVISGNRIGNGEGCAGISISGNLADAPLVYNNETEGIYCSGSSGFITHNFVRSAYANNPYGNAIHLTGDTHCTVSFNTLRNADLIASSGAPVIQSNTLVTARVTLSAGTFSQNLMAGGVYTPGTGSLVYCNDFWNAGSSAPVGVQGNFSSDPQFCGIGGSDNYYLRADSPCAPANSACGLIGAYDVGCGPISVQTRSWGALKALYRK